MSGSLRRGYTLVEALVALAVFALGMAAFLPMIVANVRANDTAAVRTQAVALAQEKVEAFRSMTFEQVVAAGSGEETVEGVFTRRWTLSPVAPDPDELVRVSVEVSWNLPGRGSGSVTLLTSKGKY